MLDGKNKLDQIQTGTVIRLKSHPSRDWVCIHESLCPDCDIRRRRKNIKNETEFILLSGLHGKDPLVGDSYSKMWGRLEMGMLPDVEVLGHITEGNYNIY